MTTGAELVIETARSLDLDVCFANPGTTELPLVHALDRVGGVRAVLGLHENVCTGAADGYARLAGKPALTLLHLGPGLANGLANLHNARRAFSPVVNLIGEHASWHLSADPPLAADIEALAGVVSRWTRRCVSAGACGRDMAEALAAVTSGRGSIATLILPHDVQTAAAGDAAPAVVRPRGYPAVDTDAVARAARLLAGAEAPAVLLGGSGLHGSGLEAAGRLGVTLIAEVSFARLETGRGRPPLRRLPYFPEQAQALLDQFDAIVVAGTRLPVSFFGYDDKPSRYLEDRDDVVLLADQEEDAASALTALAAEMGAKRAAPDSGEHPDEGAFAGSSAGLDADTIARVTTARLPEDAVAVVTAVSSSAAFYEHSRGAAPHTQIALTGGAIGEGSALSLGAGVACPGRRVVALEADGSGAYIVQALYGHARENLDVTTVICANQRYRILEIELERAGMRRPGSNATDLADLSRPALDWVSLARGFGVPGTRVTTAGELDAALARSLETAGPYLIEAVF
ncbi:MAG: acetolactate synthase large subunit [Geminicoccaceae bacterium]|nr:acetolactate synthase large subunit [Geminicoccaceae bacterium]